MAKTPTEITPGQVFIAPDGARWPSRRVVAICGDTVAYSSGGDTTHYCSVRAFRRFTRSAVPAREPPAELTLAVSE